MRHLVFGLCVLTASTSAYAQNYLPARDYSGPTTIVNMDVLQGGGFGGGFAHAPAPVLSMPLPPVDVPPAPLYAHVPSPMPLPVAPSTFDSAPMPIMPQGVAPVIHSADLGELPSADLVEPAGKPVTPAMVQPIKTPPPMIADVPPMQVASLNTAPAVPSIPNPVHEYKPVQSGIAPAGIAPVTNVASVPPVSAKTVEAEDDFEAYRLLFDMGSSELKPSEKTVLNNIIAKMKADPNIRLRMQAYAAGTPETTGQARRLSLARAMKIRTYMTENGIVATRLDVRALGMGSTGMNDTVARSKAPADRVDVIFMRG